MRGTEPQGRDKQPMTTDLCRQGYIQIMEQPGPCDRRRLALAGKLRPVWRHAPKGDANLVNARWLLMGLGLLSGSALPELWLPSLIVSCANSHTEARTPPAR